MTKFEIAISTLLIGFILGQATDISKYYLVIFRKKRALHQEVLDHQDRMNFLKSRLCSIAEMYNEGQVIGLPSPGAIETLIFNKDFADILPHLNKVERKQYGDHYGTISSFNRCAAELSDVTHKSNHIVYLYQLTCMLVETSRFIIEKRESVLNDEEEILVDCRDMAIKFANKYGLEPDEGEAANKQL